MSRQPQTNQTLSTWLLQSVTTCDSLTLTNLSKDSFLFSPWILFYTFVQSQIHRGGFAWDCLCSKPLGCSLREFHKVLLRAVEQWSVISLRIIWHECGSPKDTFYPCGGTHFSPARSSAGHYQWSTLVMYAHTRAHTCSQHAQSTQNLHERCMDRFGVCVGTWPCSTPSSRWT